MDEAEKKLVDEATSKAAADILALTTKLEVSEKSIIDSKVAADLAVVNLSRAANEAEAAKKQVVDFDSLKTKLDESEKAKTSLEADKIKVQEEASKVNVKTADDIKLKLKEHKIPEDDYKDKTLDELRLMDRMLGYNKTPTPNGTGQGLGSGSSGTESALTAHEINLEAIDKAKRRSRGIPVG